MTAEIPDYARAARQRLNAAELLHENKLNLDAMYLAGYAIECALKGLILARTSVQERREVFEGMSHGAAWHYVDNLSPLLANRGSTLPLDLVRRIRRSGWGTDLRYRTGRRDHGETRGFLKLVKAVIVWVEDETP
jgi:hypothetical protein